MDLGISGKRALVCASSKGLGRGCAMALAEAGATLVMNARGADALEATAGEIRSSTISISRTGVDADTEATACRARSVTADGSPCTLRIHWSADR